MQKFVDFPCHIVFLFLISSIYWNSSWIWFRELRRESEKIMPVYNGPSTDGSLSVCELTVSLWKFMLMLYFHVALFLCWTIFMLHFLCSNLFMLLIFLCFIIFYVALHVPLLHFRLALFLCTALFHVPAGIYLLKVNNRNTWTRCQIWSKLTILF